MSVCEHCGTDEAVINHHVSYDPEILKPLCRKCHKEEHQQPNAPKAPPGLYLPKIQIDTDTWTALNSMKKPGESFDQVLKRIISVTKEAA